MCKSDFNNEEILVDCGGIKPELLLPSTDEEDEKPLTPADYDRWDGVTGIKVIKKIDKNL